MNKSVLIASIIIILTFLVALFRKPNPLATTREGAIKALDFIQAWAQWMAGIQTATIAGLALVVSKKEDHAMTLWESTLALLAFSCLGIAVYCSAWILSSLSSQAIRVYSLPEKEESTKFDVYEQPLYGWWRQLKLGHLLSLNHWFWAVGLASFGLLVALKFIIFGD